VTDQAATWSRTSFTVRRRVCVAMKLIRRPEPLGSRAVNSAARLVLISVFALKSSEILSRLKCCRFGEAVEMASTRETHQQIRRAKRSRSTVWVPWAVMSAAVVIVIAVGFLIKFAF
jgi:hypothetical protein